MSYPIGRAHAGRRKVRSDDQHTVNSVRLVDVTGKESLLKHVEAGYAQALRAVERYTGSFITINPVVPGPRIKEHGDEEEVDQAFRLFFPIRG